MDIFDTLTYAKGSVICRMLHNYLGDAAFTRSLKKYLTRHGNGNTKTADLLDIMDEEFDPVERFIPTSEQLTVS